MENDFFKDFGQNRRLENINGTVVFQLFFFFFFFFFSCAGFFNSRLTMAVFRSRGTVPVVIKRCVDDVRDGRQEDVKVFIKERGGK